LIKEKENNEKILFPRLKQAVNLIQKSDDELNVKIEQIKKRAKTKD
jgi:hypothetical protein